MYAELNFSHFSSHNSYFYSSSPPHFTLTQSLWYDATLRTRIHNPIVVFKCVHCLQYGANTSHIAVDLRIAEEFRCQVGVQARLHIGWRVDPQRRIEEHMIEQLPRQKRETEQLQHIERGQITIPLVTNTTTKLKLNNENTQTVYAPNNTNTFSIYNSCMNIINLYKSYYKIELYIHVKDVLLLVWLLFILFV